jgi:hypothetical protein
MRGGTMLNHNDRVTYRGKPGYIYLIQPAVDILLHKQTFHLPARYQVQFDNGQTSGWLEAGVLVRAEAEKDAI